MVEEVAFETRLEVWDMGRENINKDRDGEVWYGLGGGRGSDQLSEHLVRAYSSDALQQSS